MLQSSVWIFRNLHHPLIIHSNVSSKKDPFMKRTFFKNFFALMGIAVASSSIAAMTISHAHVKQEGDSNLIGYIPVSGSDVRPFGISAIDDGSIVITSLGLLPPREGTGSILRLKPDESLFTKVNIVASKEQKFHALTSSAYSKDRKSLFVCSVPDITTFDGIAPSVVEFKVNESGDYVWNSVMNFSDETGQVCKGITVVKDRLFALNPMYSNTSEPAVYSADLSSETLPATMEVVQRYSDLGFVDQNLQNVLGVTDVIPAKNQEDNKYSVYVLDKANSSISGLTFMLGEGGSLSRLGDVSKRDIDVDSSYFPSAFASVDDNTFFVSLSPLPTEDDNDGRSNTMIYKFKYSDAGVSKELVSESYSAITAMTVAKGHLQQEGDSLFAALIKSDEQGVYNVGEYKICDNS